MVVFDPNIVWTHYLLDPTCFDPTLFGPNVYDPTFFKKPKLLLTKFFPANYFDKNKIDLEICGSNLVWTRFSSSKLTIFGPESFFNQ